MFYILFNFLQELFGTESADDTIKSTEESNISPNANGRRLYSINDDSVDPKGRSFSEQTREKIII